MPFNLTSNLTPKGDQVSAIEKILDNFKKGINEQILEGATGTGKTFTIANIINKLGKKTLVIAPNKTLAGQIYTELKELFPKDRVEYFISYYDYYQPEAYVASTDTYIEKDASINDKIDELRHSATESLLSCDNVIVVASVSCIYGIGDIDDYLNATIFLRVGDSLKRDDLINKLVQFYYERNNYERKRGSFRVSGDIVDVVPISQNSEGIRIGFSFDEIEYLERFDILSGRTKERINFFTLFPASHFVTNKEKLKIAIKNIKEELSDRIDYFNKRNELLEAERIKQRTEYDLAMLSEMGFCQGVENYSRHIALKPAGSTPTTLIDFFKDDYLLIIDESHVTIPQIGGMYQGDRSRKENLVNFGFRLPSALDNRPLRFLEFEKKKDKVLYLSATPGDYELKNNYPIIEQVIRPTYILDPEIILKSSNGQIDDLYFEIKKQVEGNEKTLVTTLTIKMSEDLTDYLKKMNIKVKYLHSKINSLERMQILRDLRCNKFDVLVGVNLLREGLDLPEVSLVAILDADKEGFLRSERSLIQTSGRAARNINGRVILYADKITKSIEKLIEKTTKRREIQKRYNTLNNLTPKTIIKKIPDIITNTIFDNKENKKIDKKIYELELEKVYEKMKEAAKDLDFEKAMYLRDIYFELKNNKNKKNDDI